VTTDCQRCRVAEAEATTHEAAAAAIARTLAAQVRRTDS
jgi:hypothetical protein